VLGVRLLSDACQELPKRQKESQPISASEGELMPKFLEQKLKAEYAAKGKKGKALARAVFGTMNVIGAMRGNKVTAKGEQMQAKHDMESHTAEQGEPKRKQRRPAMVTESHAYHWKSRENIRN
jgi:hypothetical protein